MFIGVNVTFFPMHLSGLLGMPRRVWTYTDVLGWDIWNLLSTIGAFVLATGFLIVFLDLLLHFRVAGKVDTNPWNAGTLEWLPTGNYATRSIPEVRSREPLWGNRNLREEVDSGRHYLPGLATGGRETLVTSAIDARAEYLLRIPGPSWLPVLAGLGTAAFFLLLTVKLFIASAIGAIVALVADLSFHVVEAGERDAPSVMLLHGWPQNWSAFEQLMSALAERAHCFAIDLPGIGGSETPPRSHDKRSLARCVHALIGALALRDVTLVGHDIGGQIVYAYVHEYPDLARAVLMNIVIPGIEPWAEVIRNPHIWHFAFHSVPHLPEALVSDRLAPYFEYFYNTLAATPGGVPEGARKTYVAAYSRPEALRTGFDWYRAFTKDEEDNAADKHQSVKTPVLYVRGEKEPGDMDRYLAGLRAGGLRNVRGRLIPGGGHFTSDEQPAETARAISEFLDGRGAGSN